MGRGSVALCSLLLACNTAPLHAFGAAEVTGGEGSGDEGDASSASDSLEEGTTTPEPDLPPPTECRTWEPDCPPGEKCTARLSTPGYCCLDEMVCLPVLGDDAPGEPCSAFGEYPGMTGLDSCRIGSRCDEVDPDTAAGICREFCLGDAFTCPDGSGCIVFGNPVPALCKPLCDPLDPQACAASHVCTTWGGYHFHCALASGDQGAYGTECTQPNGCDPGFFCTNAEDVPGCGGDAGCCSPYCALDQPNTCPGKDLGQACEPWFPDVAPEGYENVGGCMLP